MYTFSVFHEWLIPHLVKILQVVNMPIKMTLQFCSMYSTSTYNYMVQSMKSGWSDKFYCHTYTEHSITLPYLDEGRFGLIDLICSLLNSLEPVLAVSFSSSSSQFS